MSRWSYATLALVLLAIVVIYHPLITSDPILGRDDRRMIAALQDLHSPGEYLKAVKEGRVLDLQPIRDLSLAVDLGITKATGLRTFHLSNLVLWLLIVLVVHRILSLIISKTSILLLWTAAFAVHPAFANSVGWISARKHLLSCLFILLATWVVLRVPVERWGHRHTALVVGLYALGLLSHPINLLWPLWMVAYRWNANGTTLTRALRLLVPFLPLLVIVGALNYWYYTGAFVQQTGSEKFVGSAGTFGVGLLAFGRYFVNLALPLKLATSYYPGAALNIAGLVALPLFLFASIKLIGGKQVWLWSLFYFLPLSLVTIRMTNIFVSDTYLLVPAVGLWVILALAAEHLQGALGANRIALSAVALAIGLAALAFRQARTWLSDEALWHHAFHVEPTPNAMAKESYYLASEGKTAEAMEVALRLRQWDPGHPELGYVLARAAFLDKSLSVAAKIDVLQSHRVEQPWFRYYLASLLATEGRAAEAWTELQAALTQPQAFKDELSTVVAEAITVCRQAGNSDCQEISRPLARLPMWSEPVFQRRLRGMGAQ